jgi:serine/threonine protein kinase
MLHNKLRYAHLNLNLQNIFIDDANTVKIGGLTSAKRFDNLRKKTLLKLRKNTKDLYYLAPEVLNLSYNELD